MWSNVSKFLLSLEKGLTVSRGGARAQILFTHTCGFFEKFMYRVCFFDFLHQNKLLFKFQFSVNTLRHPHMT